MSASHFDDDPFLGRVGDLPPVRPDRNRADRTRARCRTVLAQQRRGREQPAAAVTSFQRRVLEPALVVGASVVFLAEVIGRTLHFYGL